MKEKRILHYLDLTSFVTLIIASVLVLFMQSQETIEDFAFKIKIVSGFFSIAILALTLIYEIIFMKSLKAEEIKDDQEAKELFTLSKKQRISTMIKMILSFVCFCFFAYIFFTV